MQVQAKPGVQAPAKMALSTASTPMAAASQSLPHMVYALNFSWADHA